MRDAFGPLDELVGELLTKSKHDDEDAVLSLCQVEMLLHLADAVAPGLPAGDAWVLLSGFPFLQAFGGDHEHTLRIARYWLWPLRGRYPWFNAVENYNRAEAHLRVYERIDLDAPATPRLASVAPGRRLLYASLLLNAPPFDGEALTIAGPGRHRFIRGRELVELTFPERQTTPVIGHDIDALPAGEGQPIRVSKEALAETASWMDERDDGEWQQRLLRVDFLSPEDEEAKPLDEVTINGTMHMVGMVGAGKSTLRDVLATNLVSRDRKVTLIVGDVAEVLKLVDLFTRLGLKAAPVIGASTKERHVQRMHRRMATKGKSTLLAHESASFEYLSTSCYINALTSSEPEDSLAFSEAPCGYLGVTPKRKTKTRSTTTTLSNRRGCPYWADCPRHHGYRELVDADIWVATPASLVSSSVPMHQNAERIRYLELACRRSDLIIVDEADRVQQQLDEMFAPAITLTGQGVDSWLDQLGTHKIQELARNNRTQLHNRDVENWSGALNTVQAGADRLHAMLVQEKELRDWVRNRYFNALMLQQEIAFSWFPKPKAGPDLLAPRRELLMKLFSKFREDPLGDRGEAFGDRVAESADDITGNGVDLVGITHELIHTTYPRRTRKRVAKKLLELAVAVGLELSEDMVTRQARRLSFILVLAALERRLALITAMWMRVEAALNLDSNKLYRRPPLDYGPIVAEAPMGNVLGFQFQPHGQETGELQSGELRFFRCAGMGRDLLTKLSILPAADGRPGPNVLLLSGTSWAGKSSRYHLDVPVGAVLAAPSEEVKAIGNDTVMRFCVIRDDEDVPLRVSGTDPDTRLNALLTMVRHLGFAEEGGSTTPLEQELRSIDDENRRRILLLVGSYAEAEVVADELAKVERWEDGRVARLVADDAEVGLTGDSGGTGARAQVLRRGDVSSLRDTPAEVLVAPLLALERGHNILNKENIAAIGSVYFLARPNPRPDDLVLAVHAINDWAVRALRDRSFHRWCAEAGSLGGAARVFRTKAKEEWRRVLRRSLAWSRLDDDRESVTWDMMVVIWQVIGRLVRGGVPARVTFVDAAFAPGRAVNLTDDAESSLLYSMRDALLAHRSPMASKVDARVTDLLYSPLLAALNRCLEDTTC